MKPMTCHGIQHEIKKGDTLYSLSRAYKVPLGLLLRANPYVDIYNLTVGETLCIPCMKYTDPRPPVLNDCPYAGPAGLTPADMDLGRDMAYDGLDSDLAMPQTEDTPDGIAFEYVVEEDDTLGSVLKRFGISLYELLQYTNENEIYLLPESTLTIHKKAAD